MSFNKKKLTKNNEKKVMHKVKKNWIVLSMAVFGVLGSAAFQMATTPVSANEISQESNATDSKIEHIKWGTANATYDKNTNVLTVGSSDNGSAGTIAESDGLNDINFRSDVKKIVFASPVKLPVNSSWVLGNFPNVTEFVGLDKVDTSSVVKMDNLFAQDKSVEQVDISSWNTSNVTTMNSLFDGLKSASKINVSGIDTKNVTDMFAMFAHGYKLESVIGANDLDFSNVTNMAYWFGYDPVIKSLDLSKVNAPKLQNANYMFINDVSLNYVNLSNFNSSNLIPEPEDNLTQMFFFQNEEHGDIGDNEFSSSTKPNLQSVLTTFITGSKFNTSGIRFESFGGNRGVFGTQNGDMYYSNSRPFKVVNGHLTYENDYSKKDNSINNSEQNIYASTLLWSAVQFRYIDGYTNKQYGNDYIYQGYANSTGLIPIPDGYGVSNDTNLSFKIPTREQIKANDFMNVIIYKKLNPVVNIVNDGSVVATKKYSVLQGQTIDVSNLVPSNYNLVNDANVVAAQDETPINIEVSKKTDSNNSSGSNTEIRSSSASSAETSSTSSSSASSAETSSASSSSASSAETSSAPS
ncbi:MAG: BspA family leucine-rich repeat surface protein, partial [Lactobacillaceae bacterium]